MTNATALRTRYLSDSVSTASPGQLLTMLYDRLVLDLMQAEQSLRDGDRANGTARLLHAQDIILELRTSLDTTAWSGAAGLASLYGFLITELVGANIKGDADRVATCRGLVEPLRDAWREALSAATATTAAVAAARAAAFAA